MKEDKIADLQGAKTFFEVNRYKIKHFLVKNNYNKFKKKNLHFSPVIQNKLKISTNNNKLNDKN